MALVLLHSADHGTHARRSACLAAAVHASATIMPCPPRGSLRPGQSAPARLALVTAPARPCLRGGARAAVRYLTSDPARRELRPVGMTPRLAVMIRLVAASLVKASVMTRALCAARISTSPWQANVLNHLLGSDCHHLALERSDYDLTTFFRFPSQSVSAVPNFI